jgi:hypothetical protein
MVRTMAMVPVQFPDEPEPGDVVELYRDEDADGILAAQVRIPAPTQEQPC